jgi:anti-sigma-K factor RskA
MMNHDEIRENLPAYVLGGLEPDAARAVEEHLRGCDSCRRELASYELPIYALDLSVPEASPPEGARERLLARAELGRASTDEEQEGQTEAPRQIPGRQSRLPWILAASLIVAILLGGALLQQSRQVAEQQATINSVVDLMERPDLEVRDLPTPETRSRARVYEAREGDVGMIVFDRLPRLPDGQEYQLWMGSGGDRKNEGTFALTNPERGSYHRLLAPPEGFDEYDYVGVLAAPEGGVEAPPQTSDPDWVVQSKL